MSHLTFDIVSLALDAYVERKANPPQERKPSIPFEIDIALCCVALGDVAALGVWNSSLEEATSASKSPEIKELVAALKYLHSRWHDFELKAGDGALLDYRHCLKSSPPRVVGQTRIENATKFQRTKSRVPGDPRWALGLGLV